MTPSDPYFDRVRGEAQAGALDPVMAPWLERVVLAAPDLDAVVSRRVAERLADSDLGVAALEAAFAAHVLAYPAHRHALRCDLQAVLDRDAACKRALDAVLYFKGFHALHAHRLAHALWQAERMDFALWLQSRASSVFQTDLHPAVRVGKGVFLDHATGLVVGETAVIEDDVSILQGVTLGGTGKDRGDRHPKVRHGVLIGAGAKILGNIEIGHCARVAAGSVVLQGVPPNKTVAGVPARIVGEAGCPEPARAMDHQIGALDGA